MATPKRVRTYPPRHGNTSLSHKWIINIEKKFMELSLVTALFALFHKHQLATNWDIAPVNYFSSVTKTSYALIRIVVELLSNLSGRTKSISFHNRGAPLLKNGVCNFRLFCGILK